MYIKSLVIDGFKSYAQRTEVNGFDPFFNAITGLNGSGKSNILDSICFLLGITNLSQVRATNLQELVYKNGQAGVTKATVNITFDNSDKNQSPLGYEQYEEITITRQVVIGGRNKYLINGSNANNTRVQDLFNSVQLNVNNPHFLIMQGRITKVLNMKPPEILSLIEEAAGTRLYESKKEAAQKTIGKKDAKLREMDSLLKEEITPTLTRLKDERSSYLEYQKIVRELEHLTKLYLAYKFVSAENQKQDSAEELVQVQEKIKELQQTQQKSEEDIAKLNKLIADLQQKRDEEVGGALQEIETRLNEQQKLDAKAQSNLQHKKEALKAEEKKLKALKKQKDDDKSIHEKKKKEMQKIEAVAKKLQDQCIADQEEHSTAQKHFHAVTAGLSSNKDGEDASLNEQLMATKSAISNAQTETKQAQMKLKHSKEEIKKKQNDLKKTEDGYKKDQSAHTLLKKNLEKLENELTKLNYEEGKEENLRISQRELEAEVTTLHEKVDQMGARFPQLQFDYRDPEKNFDRSKVHGLVAKLIQVKDPQTATALEVAAGGKLYNVVVDSEVTGKKLLQKGQLSRRYTIIPLNKISARAMDPSIIKRAESIVGKGNVFTALSLVEFNPTLKPAMEFVFGNVLICRDMDTAKKVAFDSKVMKKCVTLEGESFDPAGTLTGGSRSKAGAMLVKLTELQESEKHLQQAQSRMKEVQTELTNMRRTADRWRELNHQREMKQKEDQLFEDKLKQSTHHQQLEEVQGLQASIDECVNVLAEAKKEEAHASDRVKELEYKIKNAKAIREKELKQAEQEVKQAKKKIEESQKKAKEKEQEVETLRLEAEDINKEIANYDGQIAATEQAVGGYTEQTAEMQKTVDEAKNKVKEAQEDLKKQKNILRECSKDIKTREEERHACQSEIDKIGLQLQEFDHKVNKLNKDSKDAVKAVEDLLQRYEWIADEKKYFGQKNSTYDFEANNPKEAGHRLQKLQEKKEKLAKNVNMRAMNMLGIVEEQCNDLMKKRQIVLNDKAQITAVIAELDEKKREAIKKVYSQVTKDFGSIFSTLLPGTQAKLVAPEGQTILDGLEVKIAFGDVWKESLGELSGGQRSLVALSLILAMLLFKPAPLYILDEVDAALDLSHTQNIGHMLRTHFQHSQFIVVSLKDGMFNNANVLFKTKFVDGVSTVTRYVQNQPSRAGPSTSSTFGNKANKANEKSKKKSGKRARLEEQNVIE